MISRDNTILFLENYININKLLKSVKKDKL